MNRSKSFRLVEFVELVALMKMVAMVARCRICARVVMVSMLAFSANAGALEINQHGLTGAWYHPPTSGQGLQIEVYPDLSAPGRGLIQAGFFTYDSAGAQRWYTLSGPAMAGQSSAALTIYQNVGGNFLAPPVTSAQPVGTATLGFSDCVTGQLSYSFNDGRIGMTPLTRLTKNVSCVESGTNEPVNFDFGLSGNWYDASRSGQGLVIEINNVSPVAFFAWYTYAVNGMSMGAAYLSAAPHIERDGAIQ